MFPPNVDTCVLHCTALRPSQTGILIGNMWNGNFMASVNMLRVTYSLEELRETPRISVMMTCIKHDESRHTNISANITGVHKFHSP